MSNSLLVASSLVISLAAGEVVLTLLNKPPLFRYYTKALEEVRTGAWADWWVYRPGRGVYFDSAGLTDERRARLRAVTPNWARLDTVNTAGFHDADEFVVDATKWDYRLLFAGDSFTWGASADVGRSFVEVVESELKRNGARSLVWNAAIPATGTGQAVVSVQELLPAMRPHMVVLGLYENDLNDNLYPLDRFRRTSSGVAVAQYRWNTQTQTPVREGTDYIKSNLQSQIHRRESGIYGVSRLANLFRAVWQSTPDARRIALGERKLSVTQSYLREMKQRCLEQQADLLVLLIPSRHTATRTPTMEYVALENLLRSENLRFVAVRERLRHLHYANLPDNHWNNEGHGIAATALLEALSKPGNSRQSKD